MIERNSTPTDFPRSRRTIVGVLSVLLLTFSLILFVSLGVEVGSANIYVGVCLRLGLVLGSIWLAWPQIQRLTKSTPKILLASICIVLLATAVYSRLVPIVIALVSVAIVLQLVFRFVKSKSP